MGDRGSGTKRGRGRGRGGRGGQTQAIKNLERATADIHNMLQKMTVSGNEGPGRSPTAKRRPDSRGSKSLMDINVGGAPQWSGPPHQGRYPNAPPHQGQYPNAPPHQGQYPNAPPHQDPYCTGSPNRGHYKQNLSRQDHYHHGSPGHGPYPGQHYNENPQYPPAPPSYDESIRQYGGGHPQYPMQNEPEGNRKQSGQRAGNPANVQQLVKALAMFDGQMADAEALSRQVESTTEEVEKTVRQRKDLFAYMKDGRKIVVELVPNVKLCSYYQSENGCTSRESCQALHLCKDYILARCDQGPTCTYGHKFDTNHNSSILSKLYLDLLKTQHLVSVIRKVCRGNAPPKICSSYSTKKGCRHGNNCRFLHICKDYVINYGNCRTKDCNYNHQLNVKQCRNVLTQHGMSTNESVRDILLALKSSMESTSDNQPSSAGGKTKNQRKNVSADKESSDSDSFVLVPDVPKTKQVRKVCRGNAPPKICSYYSTEKGCRHGDDCRFMHICEDYVINGGNCPFKDCSYNHQLYEEQCRKVLNQHGVSTNKSFRDILQELKSYNFSSDEESSDSDSSMEVSKTQLAKIVRKVCRGNAPPKICRYYSTEMGCRHGDDCRFLHICEDYVINGGNCPFKDCSYNHQLYEEQCRNVLDDHGISANESFRDILLVLKSSTQ